MRSKNISRREFVAGAAAVAGAAILIACTPKEDFLSTEESQPNESSLSDSTTQPGSEGALLKVFIAYDSVYGNTQKIAEAMIEGIGSKYEPGIIKVHDATIADLEGVDLLILGGPTHGGTFTEPLKNFFASIPAAGLTGIKAAAFDTSFTLESQGAFVRFLMKTLGYAAPKIAKNLGNKGADVIASEIFYVIDTEGPLKEGEIERANAWAEALVQQVMA